MRSMTRRAAVLAGLGAIASAAEAAAAETLTRTGYRAAEHRGLEVQVLVP